MCEASPSQIRCQGSLTNKFRDEQIDPTACRMYIAEDSKTIGATVMRVHLAATIAMAALLWSAAAGAHHGFSAEFDGSKPIELKGVVTKVEWANPHVYFYIDVHDDKQGKVSWGCETAGPGSLHRQGWTQSSLKVGDQVIVDGYPAKDGSKLADARNVTFADGRKLLGATPGDGGPGSPKY